MGTATLYPPFSCFFFSKSQRFFRWLFVFAECRPGHPLPPSQPEYEDEEEEEDELDMAAPVVV